MRKWILIFIGAALAAMLAWWFFGSDSDSGRQGASHEVSRRDIVISVTESGNLESLNALEINSQVEGRVQIISIVPDGYVVTPEDVENGLVLVELDSAALREKKAQQEITYESALADYTQATESFEIQKNQNESNIRAGELAVRFARMDLERYLGRQLADALLNGEVALSDLGMDANDVEAAAERLNSLHLAGAARREWSKLQSDVDLANEEAKRADADYESTRELGDKGYVPLSEVEAYRLKLQARRAEAVQAELAVGLFLQYDLPKEAEQLHSDYLEAQQELERIKAKARAELAKAQSQMKSKEAAYNLQKDRLEQLREQIENCTIRAPRPGMVVYASTVDRRGRTQDLIEEGAEVRERQALLRMPDDTSMSVKIKVNESVINQVAVGQTATVVAEPFPEEELRGHVTRIATTPDPTSFWMSPDTQTYTTVVSIDNPSPNLKPGMSARVQVFIDEVRDVVAVPVQAVTLIGGVRAVYMPGADGPVAHPVETGRANDTYIEIKSGLQAGDTVLLYRPENADDDAVMALAKKREAEAKQGAAQRVASASEAPAETSDAPEQQNVEAASEETPEWIESIPEEVRSRVLERWRAASPEERQRMAERVKSGGGRRPGGNREEPSP